MSKDAIHLTIDGKVISVRKGTTIYHAAKSIGIDIPIFCYHDRMPPFGACRMCLVEVENMSKLQASCTLEVFEGMVVKTQSVIAKEGRESVLELLLINHPLDCPICDRGGECPLQENVVEHGPGKSRFYEEKRRLKKRVALGPMLMLDQERCIACARCTRFSDTVAGDHALEFIERGYKTEITASCESKFIGNTISICPVGALTSQLYRFRARPWDNRVAKTTCTLCPVGCSMALESRDEKLMRARVVENRNVNDVWLCDKGWFGYEHISHPSRLKQPLIRREGVLQPASWEEALQLISEKFTEAKNGGRVAGWGGNPLTVEENYLFQKLIREGAKCDHVDHRIGDPIVAIEGVAPGMAIEIGQCENLTSAVLLGLDITEEFPIVWLRLKEAINRGAKIYFFGHYAPEVAKYLAGVFLHPPGEELEMLERNKEILSSAQALFVGRQYLATSHREAILCKLDRERLNIMEGKDNSMGARFAGMVPSVGKNAIQVLTLASQERWDLLYIAGANPATKYPPALWERARSNIGFLIVQDLFLTESAQQADVVLPTLCFAEKSGTFINIEGRVERVEPAKKVPPLYSDAEIFLSIASKIDVDLSSLESFLKRLQVKKVARAAPISQVIENLPVADPQNMRATFAPALFNKGVRMRYNAHLVQLAKEPCARICPEEARRRGVGEGSEIVVQGSTLKLCFDTAVAAKTVVLPESNILANPLNGFEVDLC